MAECLLNKPSGSSYSDDCTATAEDVLESVTAIYNGSDDEAAAGSMVDYSGTTKSASASLDSTNSRLRLTVPATGKYSTTSKIYAAYSTIRSLIGLTAAKIATGVSILGLTGTYTGKGSATQDQVLTGKTFSTASLSGASGTMPNLNTNSTVTYTSSNSTKVLKGDAAYLSTNSDGTIRAEIRYNSTAGYIPANTLVGIPYATMASALGVTSSVLLNGKSCLGVTGSGKYIDYIGEEIYYANRSTQTNTSLESLGTYYADYPYLMFRISASYNSNLSDSSAATSNYTYPFKTSYSQIIGVGKGSGSGADNASCNACWVPFCYTSNTSLCYLGLIVIGRDSNGTIYIDWVASSTTEAGYTGTWSIVVLAGTNCDINSY